MRKLVFIVSVFVLSALFADGSTEKSNWIYYDGWVTGPGSDKNKDTYLLPFMFTNVYSDESPLLYETDMGWPVPDEEEKNLKYLFFGDTYFFMRDSKNNIMSKITDGSETLLDFGVDNNAAEISRQSNFLPEGGIHLTTIIQDIYDSCLEDCLKENQNGSDSCARYCYNKLVNNPEDHCLDDCLKEYPESEYCEKSCINKFANKTNYSDCFSFCNDCEALKNEPDIFDYMDFKSGSKEDICKNFCQFDMVDTYTPGQYFSYDFNDNPTNGQVYNNGTSNIFLAATLEKNNSGNNTRYNIKFHHPDNEESGSAQIYSVADATKRRSKSIWMDSYERSFLGFIGIYPRGYFYACPESQGNDCGTKKLFVPYMIRNWNLFNTQIFGENLRIHLNLPDDTQFIITGSNLDKDLTNLFQKLKAKGFKFYDFDKEFARQSQSLGHGIYDFDKEYRMVFSKGTTYPNKHVLWPFSSKMSNMTVIHDISRDLLSIDDNKEYVYFMGTGEIEIDSSKFYIKRKKEKNGYVYEFVTKDGYKAEDVVKSTQKAYIARVPAYEKEIKYAASYEYFTGITNGIARWKKDINKAKPLYGFYPLTAMGAESIVQHRDLYWMTASLNETTTTKTHENKKGVAVLASPDALHWQKVDTILFDNPESIGTNYAFFWLPPKLIEEDDNTMPFLYSIWKADKDATSGKFNLKGFLDDSLDPKFTHYNLKAGKYKFMEKSATRAFLADNAEYGYTFLNTIPGNTPEGTKDFPISYFVSGKIPLPFKTFQNLDNLKHAGLTGSELNAKKEELKNRYAVIEYCYCGNQNEEQCKKFDTGNCPPYKDFIQTEEKGNDVGNWKIIDIVENKFFEEHVKICKNGNENIPDYMCNIPFEHGKASPQGQRSIPVWNWWKQIAADYPTWNKDSAKVILRFSHWQDIGPDEKLTFEQGNYIKINKQLMENNKLVPFDCDGSGSSEITATCQDPTSWRTSNQLTLKFRPFSDFMIDPRIDLNFASLPKIRLEYLYPYPVMISDYGKPGDPAPWTWDMFVADHFAKEFFKVGSFEYGDSVTQSLMPGAAMTAAIKNGTMQIYAWGGENQNLIKRILFKNNFCT